MVNHFNKIQNYLLDLGMTIAKEDEQDHYFIVEDSDNGINNMMIYVEDPIVVVEQFIFELKNHDAEVLAGLLKINRNTVHGALALNESGTKVLYRDTLQLDSLDFNELEASINSLSLMLSEYTTDILKYADA